VRLLTTCFLLTTVAVAVPSAGAQRSEPLIVDHTCTDITLIPEAGINQARATLHIAYGHTSHGSQLTDGMTGLITFANGGGLGLSLPDSIFTWNNGGIGGALDLHDYAMALDLGYYPLWVDETRDYLDNNPETNVIIWAWCGDVDNKYVAGTLDSEYLTPMNQLELDYPGVTFVYMTGHVDHGSDTNNKLANQMVRDYCVNNNKVLYDFADIECYDPDNTFFEFPNDNCDYYESEFGPLLGNWAIEWQNSHTENVDWYTCDAAHTQPLNANQKAYAAWWLWVSISGYEIPTGAPGSDDTPRSIGLDQNSPNPFNPATRIVYHVAETTQIELSVYDVRGKRIRTLVEGQSASGSFTAWWDGTDGEGQRVSSGVYFYRLTAGRSVHTRKMVLLE
jgi:hypothetical protein